MEFSTILFIARPTNIVYRPEAQLWTRDQLLAAGAARKLLPENSHLSSCIQLNELPAGIKSRVSSLGIKVSLPWASLNTSLHSRFLYWLHRFARELNIKADSNRHLNLPTLLFTGIILVFTLFCHTQKVTEPDRHVLETKPTPNGHIIIKEKQETSKGPQKKEWKFEDYLKKFEPSTIWEQIDKQKKYNGLILTNEEQSEIMYRAMDPTVELMELKIEKGDPKLLTLDKDGRRQLKGWRPPHRPGYRKDRFYLRNRLYELMKQAIYESRNKMVIMQIYREKYLNSSLYKMGFLFNKADNAAKIFGMFSFRAYRGCLLARERIMFRLPIYDLLAANERQLNLWFNVELIVDLIETNDLIAKEIFQNNSVKRMKKFDKNFIDWIRFYFIFIFFY